MIMKKYIFLIVTVVCLFACKDGDVEETGILIAVDEILEDKRIRHIQTFIESHPDALRLSSCEGEEVFTPKVVTPQADCSR